MFGRVACVITLVVLATGAPAATGDVQSWEIAPGTDAALVEDHRVPVVHLVIEFPAGSWSPWMREVHGEEAFRGQLYDPEGELRRRADQLALDLRFRVTALSSEISATFLREDLDDVVELLQEILANRRIDRKELKRWKNERRIGWKASLKTPMFRLEQVGARSLFRAGDPRRFAWEEPDPLSTDVEKLARARDRLIRLPGRIVGFAGGIELDDARRVAAELLPPAEVDIPDRLDPEFFPVVKHSDRRTDRSVTLPSLTQVYFMYGRNSPVYRDPEYPAFMIADHVLGGHFHSRLYEALRHEEGDTYGARTAGAGSIVELHYRMQTFTRLDNAEQTETKLKKVLGDFHGAGITEEERVAAVGFLQGRLAFRRQTPWQILYTFLRERRIDLPHGHRDDMVRRASELTLEEINTFIGNYYDPGHFTMLKLGPGGS